MCFKISRISWGLTATTSGDLGLMGWTSRWLVTNRALLGCKSSQRLNSSRLCQGEFGCLQESAAGGSWCVCDVWGLASCFFLVCVCVDVECVYRLDLYDCMMLYRMHVNIWIVVYDISLLIISIIHIYIYGILLLYIYNIVRTHSLYSSTIIIHLYKWIYIYI